MRNILLGFLSFVSISCVSADASANSSGRECFREHLREAIALNKSRQPLYSQLSNGASLEISSKLISGEKFAKFASYLFYNFDVRAEAYHAQGINIVCDEFVSMRLTPSFRSYQPGPNLAVYQPLNIRDLQFELMYSLRDGFPEVRETAIRWIREIEKRDANAKHPRLHCMIKHVLDSIARIATLAPGHMSRTRELGLPSTESLSRSMISSHFMVLKSSGELDDLAAPLQAAGLPILCQDVPPIAF